MLFFSGIDSHGFKGRIKNLVCNDGGSVIMAMVFVTTGATHNILLGGSWSDSNGLIRPRVQHFTRMPEYNTTRMKRFARKSCPRRRNNHECCGKRYSLLEVSTLLEGFYPFRSFCPNTRPLGRERLPDLSFLPEYPNTLTPIPNFVSGLFNRI